MNVSPQPSPTDPPAAATTSGDDVHAQAQPDVGTAGTQAIPDGAMCLLRCVVVCDLADSTALFERLGDQRAAELIRRHDRLVRDLIREHGGQEIDKTDGFLALFERPVQAVGFSLACQRALRRFSTEEELPLAARIGVHLGEVVLWQNSADDIAKGAKPVEVEGLVKPLAARLMSLASPGQILMSGVVYSIAHRAEGELGALMPRVRWRSHGRYRFKGVPEPVQVFEVGEEGIAPLRAPSWSGKAYREVPLWRRPLMLAVEMIALLALLSIPLWDFFRPQPAIAFAERDWVVVADLRNLTDDRRFDSSLHEAFRIGLEQSRHINVLSDLQVSAALERMQRDPNSAVDRTVGSEIALREGARALILTSLAEIGGRVRYTAEVVDPATQATVYAESADGVGVASVLSSVDRVNRQLRERLGEALAAVTEDSMPLEKVATANFDALRAYTMGMQAKRANLFNDALALLRQAINTDPEFGRARLELSALLVENGDRAGALLELHRAIEKPERLSVRDRLHAEASIANLSDTPANVIERWRLLANLYPDDFRAQGALGYNLWYFGNRYDDAIRAVEHNAHPANPRRGLGHYLLGQLYMGQERFDEAIEQFRASEELGRRFENTAYASAYAARNEFALAQRTLARGRASGSVYSQFGRMLTAATFKLDQGDWAGASKDLASGHEWSDITDNLRQSLFGLQLGLASLTEEPERFAGLLDQRLKSFVAARITQDPLWYAEHQQRVLLVAWLAARAGQVAIARQAMAHLDSELKIREYPILWQWHDMVVAELMRAEGKPDTAVGILRGIADDDDRLVLVHVSMVDALAESGQHAAALEEARWLTGHRGRAYSETTANMMVVPLNVAYSRLGWLFQAEQAIQLGQADVAAAALERFSHVWLTNQLPPPVSGRWAAARAAVAELATGRGAGS